LLGGEVQRFEHLPTDDPPRVAVTLNLALVRANDRSSMSSRQYSGEEMVDAQTPDAMADAFNRLTARLLAEAVRDLQEIQSRLTP
jgi:cholesterol transport system auxiliary component